MVVGVHVGADDCRGCAAAHRARVPVFDLGYYWRGPCVDDGANVAADAGAMARDVYLWIMQNALYLGLNFVAMTRVEASLAAIIASTMPLMVAFFGWILFREKLRPLAVIGLVAGVVGVGLIMGSRISGGTDIGYVSLCFIAALALTVATLSVRGASTGGNVMMIVGLQMFVGSALLAVSALLFETWSVHWSPRLIGAFAYTTLIPGVLATWIWFWLVGRIGAVKAATFHFLNPFFGVAIAAAFLGEQLGSTDIIGVMIIAGGILAVQLSRQAR